MPEFLATCPRGLNEVLQQEIKAMGVSARDTIKSGVFFEGTWEDCYKVNLYSRIASRVVKPLLDFVAYQPEELYEHVRSHDFTKYIDKDQTFSIDASSEESKLGDQRYVAMKVKDAIADQFTDAFGSRPDVARENPDMIIVVKVFKNRFNIFLDTSGDSLFKRGYRMETREAPMKENLAAGLLALAEWKEEQPLIDPMCGSGTILIEAALRQKNIAPGVLRKRFGFQNLKNYNEDTWKKLVDEAIDKEREDVTPILFGYDIDRKALEAARANARRAGVDDIITFQKENVGTLTSPIPEGVVITNPPYGARLGDEDNLRDVYRDFSHTLKVGFKGWDAWILSGNKDLIGDLKLKSSRKHFVFNGPLECRFLKYSMR
ncbi:MAG: THUMP domain-containing protein [Bdellovibrionota bacterium]